MPFRQTNETKTKHVKSEQSMESNGHHNQTLIKEGKPHIKHNKKETVGELSLSRDSNSGRNVFVGPNGFIKYQVPWRVPVNRVTPEGSDNSNSNNSNSNTTLNSRRSRQTSSPPPLSLQQSISMPSIKPDTPTPPSPPTIVQQLEATPSRTALPNGFLDQNSIFKTLLMRKNNRSKRRRSTIISVDDQKDTLSIESVESVAEAIGRSRLDLETLESDDALDEVVEKDVEIQVARSKSRARGDTAIKVNRK